MIIPSTFVESSEPANLLDSTVPMRRVRRRIDPRSGRALEILGHAIEYLSDEYVCACMKGSTAPAAGDGRVQAIPLLMAANRAVYLQCPEVEDLATRCLSILRRCRPSKAEKIAAAG